MSFKCKGSEDSGGLGPGPRGGVLGPERERSLAQDWGGLWSCMLVARRYHGRHTGAVSPPDGSVLIGGGNSVPAKLQKDLLFTFMNQGISELAMMQGV